MGRRSFIPITAINRMISRSNRIAREKSNIELINAQYNKQKELPPEYKLKSVSFNPDTRITKIIFLQTQKYRTILRYVTQNYQKYPIYSNFKIKTKEITKTIKLTNTELENLNQNEDDLVKCFARDIIIALNSEELQPSWFIEYFITTEYMEKVDLINQKLENVRNENFNKTNDLNRQLRVLNDKEVEKNNKKIIQLGVKLKLEKLLTKIEHRKKSIFFSIITFGIYTYCISEKRKTKIKTQIETANTIVREIENEINSYNNEKSILKKKIKEISKATKDLELRTDETLKEENRIFTEKCNQIEPLQTAVTNDDKFIPLKNLSGLTQEKLIGCYIIRNTENNKCYVGQSKDVLKRMKQHFKGTTPNNVIFAEDYFCSTLENKEDLFEFKIIKCTTKDELDSTERALIEQYGALNTGYNRTSGNT